MSKSSFRVLLVVYLFVSILSGVYDGEIITNDLFYFKINSYVAGISVPISPYSKFLLLVGLAVIAIICLIASFIGLFLFRPWGRMLYTIGFLLIFITPFSGILVYSFIAQTIYDISLVLSGFILALIYFSPMADYFKKSHTKLTVNDN